MSIRDGSLALTGLANKNGMASAKAFRRNIGEIPVGRQRSKIVQADGIAVVSKVQIKEQKIRLDRLVAALLVRVASDFIGEEVD